MVRAQTASAHACAHALTQTGACPAGGVNTNEKMILLRKSIVYMYIREIMREDNNVSVILTA